MTVRTSRRLPSGTDCRAWRRGLLAPPLGMKQMFIGTYWYRLPGCSVQVSERRKSEGRNLNLREHVIVLLYV